MTRSCLNRATGSASRIGGEHIQAIDEPYIAKVGAHLSEAINRIQGIETRETQPK